MNDKFSLNMKKKGKIAYFIAVLFIILLCMQKIKYLIMPYVMCDEFGYWGNAFSTIGGDWGDLLSNTEYYSYGYSLILVPIMSFIPIAYMYQVAIIINCILLVGAYFCTVYAIKKLWFGMEHHQVAWMAFAITTGECLFQTQIAWTETLLYFLMWLSILLLFKIEDNCSIFNVLLLLVVDIYMYIVHQRAIGVLISVVFAIVLISSNQRAYHLVVISVAVIIIGFYAQQKICMLQNEFIYNGNELVSLNVINVNDAVDEYSRLILSNFPMLIESFIGKVFAAICESGITLFIPIVVCAKYAVDLILSHCLEKKHIIYFYIVSSFLIMLVLTTLRMKGDYRKDVIVYTRYYYYTFAPMVMLGVGELLDNPLGYKKSITLSLIILCISSKVVIHFKSDGFFNYLCSPYIAGFIRFSKVSLQSTNEIKTAIVLIVIIAFALYFSLRVNSTCYIFLLCFVNILSFYYVRDWAMEERQYIQDYVCIARDWLETTEYEEIQFYASSNSRNDHYARVKYLQFVLGNQQINVIEDTKEATDLVIVYNDEKFQKDGYVLLFETKGLNFYAKKR